MNSSKILSKKVLKRKLLTLKKQGRRIVFTNGCFDILHSGHVYYLAKAKQLGDILVLGINSDASVKKIKGPKRPINTLRDRMAVMAGLESVDFVCAFSETTPLKLIQALKPTVLVKGGDWKAHPIVGADVVKSYGGTIRIIPFQKGRSTTTIIHKIQASHC